MSRPPLRKTLTLVFVLSLFAVAFGLAAWTTLSPSAAPVTPTVRQPFALLKIPKPSATPTSVPTAIPLIQPLAESQALAEVVVDTPAPGYSDTTPDDPPPLYTGNKYILVDISEQHMYVYEGDTLVNDFVSSTGMNNATRAGSFSVLDKIPSAYGATWDIWMPYWLGIYWAGGMENGIHALPLLPGGGALWEGYLGVPISYGCVVLGNYEAQWLYDWADIGTPVEIQW